MQSAPSQWEMVRELKPVKLTGVSFQDRSVRGEPWTFAHNDISGQHVRVNGLARDILTAMDGRTTVQALVDERSVMPDELESIASTLLTLAHYGVISLSDSHHQDRLLSRQAQIVGQRKPSWYNPLAIRVPLHDPDSWLSRLCLAIRPVLSRSLLMALLSILGLGVILMILNWDRLGMQLRIVAQSPQQWWQLLIVYPLLKCAHELAHAMCIKRFGGSVHEVGITVLVLMPIPYVDASDSWRFKSRSRRVLVSAAGMLAEGLLASIGLFVWLVVEPGLLSNLGFATALIGSFSTLFFNANPLLKFDGYQILQDVLDMPNLASRSTRYLFYLGRRYGLQVSTAQSPVTGKGERRWLISYGLCAGCYRWVITLAIALYLTSRFPLVGAALAFFALYQLTIKPLFRLVNYLVNSVELQGARWRASSLSALGAGSVVLALLVLPVPTSTRAEGIVELAQQAQVFAPQSGEVGEVMAEPGSYVQAGQAILRLIEPELHTLEHVQNSELDKLKLSHLAALVNEPLAAPSLAEDIQERAQALADTSKSVLDLTVRASVNGVLSLDPLLTRVGAYVEAGNSVGHIVNQADLRVKAVVRERDIARVEKGVNGVRIRLAERFGEPLTAELTQATPAGSRVLPSQALAYNGFSGIAVASDEQHQLKTLEPVFHLEFSLPTHVTATGIGGRAYITLAHDAETIAQRSWRGLRQLLLNQLAI